MSEHKCTSNIIMRYKSKDTIDFFVYMLAIDIAKVLLIWL